MKQVFGIAAADFTERRRRFSFLAVVALALFAAYCFVPNSNVGALIVEPGIFIQGGHPSWMPATSAWGISIFLPLLGFFYVSGTLAFDERTGVRQYADTAPASSLAYLFGKHISNFLLLLCLIFAVFAGSLAMSIIHFPGQALPLRAAATIFLPSVAAAALVSALAVLFESSRVLGRNIGAVVFVAIWILLLAAAFGFNGEGARASGVPLWVRLLDVNGLTSLYADAQREVLAQSGRPLQDINFLAFGARSGSGTATLIFHGIPLTRGQVSLWLGQIAVSVAMVLAAAPIYAAAGRVRRARKNIAADEAPGAFSLAQYRPGEMPRSRSSNPFGGLLAEMRLMLAGLPLAWYLAAAGGMALCAFLPMGAAWTVLLLLPVWCLGVFSGMGCREYENGTLQCVAVLPNGLLRQIARAWASGVIICGALAAPMIIRQALAGNAATVLSCAGGAVFIPSLALFLGEWTRTRRVFAVAFIVLAYLNLNYVPALMYFEYRPEHLSTARSAAFLAAGLALAAAGILKRARPRRAILA
jgi:ABC-type transport system involved in multi-copper enzyme maturation permease subunit